MWGAGPSSSMRRMRSHGGGSASATGAGERALDAGRRPTIKPAGSHGPDEIECAQSGARWRRGSMQARAGNPSRPITPTAALLVRVAPRRAVARHEYHAVGSRQRPRHADLGVSDARLRAGAGETDARRRAELRGSSGRPWPAWDPANGYYRDHDVRKQSTARSSRAGAASPTAITGSGEFYERRAPDNRSRRPQLAGGAGPPRRLAGPATCGG